MEKKTLSNILEGKIFKIPDYQRGYAWENKQLQDFVQDIDALIDEETKSHYTGTIVIFQPKNEPIEHYGINQLEVVDVVDGQQRITTSSLYLSIILNKLIERGKDEFKEAIPIYLYSGSKSKLRLNNDTEHFFFDLISKGNANVNETTIHQKRLLDAYKFLDTHIENQSKNRDTISYLTNLFNAITRKLNFSFYPIEEESEIGMTFELMNSRGKDLSSLELLKNYLMYWVYRNVLNDSDKEDLTHLINKSWKEVYLNIAESNSSENQCLRLGWTLYHNHSPKKWDGYTGFKANDVIPLRDFKKKSKEDTQLFIAEFTTGLAEISKHYSAILQPNDKSVLPSETKWLTKIKNAGNIASYLPLMVASRKKVVDGDVTIKTYIRLLKALELFSYRVFLWEGKRSNTGLSKFYKWADDVFSSRQSLDTVIDWILGTINLYSNENRFRKELDEEPYEWFYWRRLLKYTLYEYELYLLDTEGKGSTPKLAWRDLSDATIEHILPQNPKENSYWKQSWSEAEIKKYLHDISNLVLTKDNSHYLNFDFDRKKGSSGVGHCYSNSDIRQERKIAEFDEWTATNSQKRREELVFWIIDRWGIDEHFELPDDVLEPELEDSIDD